jgi:hypothetical protein
MLLNSGSAQQACEVLLEGIVILPFREISDVARALDVGSLCVPSCIVTCTFGATALLCASRHWQSSHTHKGEQ